jgi:hypothetical protein
MSNTSVTVSCYDINFVKYLISLINDTNIQYKQYCSNILMEYNNIFYFNDETKKIYDSKFHKLNIDFIIHFRNNILNLIDNVNHIYSKYKIEKKVVLFASPFYYYKEYTWIDDISNFTTEYVIYDLYTLLNYLLDRLNSYNNKVLGELSNDILLLKNI